MLALLGPVPEMLTQRTLTRRVSAPDNENGRRDRLKPDPAAVSGRVRCTRPASDRRPYWAAGALLIFSTSQAKVGLVMFSGVQASAPLTVARRPCDARSDHAHR